MRSRVSRAAACLLIATVAVAPSLSFAAAAPYGADSPAAVVDGLRAAGEAQDFSAMARLLAPEARAQMTLSLVIGTTMMVAFAQMGGAMAEGMAEAFADEEAEEDAEAKAERERQQAEAEAKAAELEARLEAVLKKHGLDEAMGEGMELDDEAGPEALTAALEGVDQPALIGELMDLMSSLGEESGSPSSGVPVGPLEDLVIEGDRATGTVNDEPAEFVKIDGRWYFSPPEADL